MGEAILSLFKMPIMLYTRLKKIPLAYISVNNKKIQELESKNLEICKYQIGLMENSNSPILAKKYLIVVQFLLESINCKYLMSPYCSFFFL